MSLVFLILGCFMGAGFVSGKEIATYFTRFGINSIYGIIFACILLFILIYLFFLLSTRVNSFSRFVEVYFGKVGTLISWLFALCILILISSMLAGSVAIAEVYNVSPNIMIFLTASIAFVVSISNVKIVSVVNQIIMPILIVILLINILPVSVTASNSASGVFPSILSAGNYIFINIVTLGFFILEIGGSCTKRQMLLASLISSVIIGVLLFLGSSAITTCGTIFEDMPILSIAMTKGNILGILTGIIIWFGLFTTLISCIYMLSNFIDRYVRNKLVSVGLSILLGLLISSFGFGFIINYIYSIIGLMGIIIVIRVVLREKQTMFKFSKTT